MHYKEELPPSLASTTLDSAKHPPTRSPFPSLNAAQQRRWLQSGGLRIRTFSSLRCTGGSRARLPSCWPLPSSRPSSSPAGTLVSRALHLILHWPVNKLLTLYTLHSLLGGLSSRANRHSSILHLPLRPRDPRPPNRTVPCRPPYLQLRLADLPQICCDFSDTRSNCLIHTVVMALQPDLPAVGDGGSGLGFNSAGRGWQGTIEREAHLFHRSFSGPRRRARCSSHLPR